MQPCQCGTPMDDHPHVAGITECPHCDRHCTTPPADCPLCIAAGKADGRGPGARHHR